MIMRLLSTCTALFYCVFLKKAFVISLFYLKICGIYVNTGIPVVDTSLLIHMFTSLQKTMQ